MMSTDKQEIIQRVYSCIENHREEVIRIGEDIRIHPELGFKENRTADIVQHHLKQLGVPFESGIALTGVKGLLSRQSGEKPGVRVAYLGELDSVLVRNHPDADPETGAAHACGHNAQIAALIALAYGLVESEAMAHLDGDVALMAVPAEEYVEVEYRLKLRESGKIHYLGGKPEMIRLGAFDDIDITLSTHLSASDKYKMGANGLSNGCLVKQVRFSGKASHAGGSPHSGINALRAAMIAMQSIDAIRETFKDEDHIRVHPIITKGGELVNVIPDDVTLETYVRGASIEAIDQAAKKVDRCLKAGAMALRATVHITSLPGYLPRAISEELTEIYCRNACSLVGKDMWREPTFGAGSSDMGDVSHLMPALEGSASGATGTGHGADYSISDPETAYITPAKVAAATLIDLLWDGAGEARKVLDNYKPPMTKEEYLDYMDGLFAGITWKWEE